MIVQLSVKIYLECTAINDNSDCPEIYWKMLIGRFPGFSKLLRVSHHLKNNLDLVSPLQEYTCDIICHVLLAGLIAIG